MDVRKISRYTLKLAVSILIAFCLIVSGAVFLGSLSSLLIESDERLTTKIILTISALFIFVATFFAGKWMRKNYPI